MTDCVLFLAEICRSGFIVACRRHGINQKTRGLVQDKDTQTYLLRPVARYRLGEDVTVEGGYQFIREENRVSDKTTDRNKVYLNLSMDFPTDW